jgi:hypothetical protein
MLPSFVNSELCYISVFIYEMLFSVMLMYSSSLSSRKDFFQSFLTYDLLPILIAFLGFLLSSPLTLSKILFLS